MILGGGGIAAALVAVIVAVTVMSDSSGSNASGKPSGSLPSAEDLPSGSGQPEPTFEDKPPPPPPPIDFVSDAKRDKAPLSAGTLFPDKKFVYKGRGYELAATDAGKKCADAAHAGLKSVLSNSDCRGVYRATLTRGGIAATVGIAVFDDTAAAVEVRDAYKPNIVALPGKGVPDFCRTSQCRTTVNSTGRYAFFTIAGHTNGKDADDKDKVADRAAKDASAYAATRVMERGKEQSQKAAETAEAD